MYLAGLWVIAIIARETAGWRGFWWALAIGALWPFGFQNGRQAGWYSLCFLEIAVATYQYLKLATDSATGSRWWKLGVTCVLLLYTNYFCWLVIACLATDYFLFQRKFAGWKRPCILGGVLALAFLPLTPAFLSEIQAAAGREHATLAALGARTLTLDRVEIGADSMRTLVGGGYIPLWLWPLSIPELIAIPLCLLVAILWSAGPIRRILCYFLLLLGGMSVIGLESDVPRAFFLAPWLLLPIAVVGASEATRGRAWTWLSLLLVIAVAGWIGIINSTFRAKFAMTEPWPGVMEDLTKDLENGDAVATSDPEFYFYLNYELGLAQQGSDEPYFGLAAYISKGAHVYNIGSDAEPPSYQGPGKVIAAARWPNLAEPARWPNANCTLKSVRVSIPDAEYESKKRYYPATKQQPHPFQIAEYPTVTPVGR